MILAKPKYTISRCETKYIALDCHKQYDHAIVIDTETGETKSRRLAHIKEDFREFIGDRAGTTVVISRAETGPGHMSSSKIW